MTNAPDFKIEEFVPKAVFDKYGESSIRFLDPDLPKIAQAIRDHFALPMTVNNWSWGGRFQYRGFDDGGFRGFKSFSQHRFGRALDFNIEGLESDEVYYEMLDYEEKFFDLGIRRMEDRNYADTWTHIDLAETYMDGIYIFLP